MICTRGERQCWSKQQAGTSAQIAPVVELVGIFGPAVADVRAVVHVGDEDVLDAGIDLGLSLLHGLTGADNDEHNAGSAGNQPLAVHYFYVFDVNALGNGLLEDDGVVFREGFESGVVVKGKRRGDDEDGHLKDAERGTLTLDTPGGPPKEVPDRCGQFFLPSSQDP